MSVRYYASEVYCIYLNLRYCVGTVDKRRQQKIVASQNKLS